MRMLKKGGPTVKHVLYLSVGCLIFCTLAHADFADRLLAFTGAERVKVVWTRGSSFGFQNDWGTDQTLHGFDTKTGTEVTIVSELGNYQRPLLSRDGRWVVYSSRSDTGIHIVDFGGDSTPKRIATGVAGALYVEQSTGNEYALYAVQCMGPSVAPLRRVNIHDPDDDSLFHDFGTDTKVDGQWLAASEGGTKFGGVFPWPNVKAYSADGRAHVSANGCWTSMPYDTTGRIVFLTPAHNGIVVGKPGRGTTGFTDTLHFNQHFGDPEFAMNHARMASYSTLFLCASVGMDPEGGRSGGDISIFLLNDSLSAIEDSVFYPRTAAGAEAFPDMWAGDMDDTVEIADRSGPPLPHRVAPDAGTDLSQRIVDAVYTCTGQVCPEGISAVGTCWREAHGTLVPGTYVLRLRDGSVSHRTLKVVVGP